MSSIRTFRKHALDRVLERLHMEPRDVLHMINWDFVVLLGEEGDKVHKLFYSEVDQNWFVAISDEETKEIVTVLPYDYHNRWRIAPGALEQARKVATKGCKKEEAKQNPIVGTGQNQSASVVTVRGYFRMPDGGVKHKTLCRLAISEYGSDLDALLVDVRAREIIIASMDEYLQEGARLDSVILRLGTVKNGKYKTISSELLFRRAD